MSIFTMELIKKPLPRYLFTFEDTCISKITMPHEWFQTELTHFLSFACYSQKERSSKQKDKCNPRGSKCLARERDSASLILASSSARLLVSPSDDNPWGSRDWRHSPFWRTAHPKDALSILVPPFCHFWWVLFHCHPFCQFVWF